MDEEPQRSREIYRSAWTLFFVIAVTVFLAEFLVLTVMWSVIPSIDPLVHGVVDAAMISLVVSPLIYVLAIRPLARQVERRERTERRLREAKEELEILNRLLRHDVRNDMQLIYGWTEALEDHVDPGGEDTLRRLQDVSLDVVELTESVRGLIEVLRGEGPRLEPVDLGEVVEREVEKAGTKFDEADYRIVGGLPDVEVRANRMLSPALGNILNNAVKHSDRECPEVEVSVEEVDGSVVVSVADDGPGVPDEAKDEIFVRTREDSGPSGAGIGLYLVDRLVSQYGGEVWVEDNEPRGAVFKVELERAAPR